MKIVLTADPEIPVPPTLYGGIERILDVLVHGYVEKGHQVTLFAHPGSKVPCRLIPWKGTLSSGLGNMIANGSQLLSHILTERYDVVHSFSRLAYLTPLLPLRVPKMMSYQREPTVAQIQKAMQLAKKGTILFTGCSDYIARQIKPIANAVTVYNCVPIERYDYTGSVDEDAPLTFLGRIEPIKGTHLAIEIAKRTNRQLIIAGNVPAEGKAYFEEKIRPFLSNRIRYVGPVNDEQKNKLLGTSAALLMPIQWNEPFGIVMAEAMACGTPVLGFPFGAVPEVVDHGVTGFICRDMEEMTETVKNVGKISRRSVRLSAESRFSNRVIVDEYLRYYETIQQKKTVATM